MAFTWSELGDSDSSVEGVWLPFMGAPVLDKELKTILRASKQEMLWLDCCVSCRLEVNKLGSDDENSSYTHQEIKYNPWKACLSVLTWIFRQGKVWSFERRFLKSTSQLNNLILPLIADNKLRKQYSDIDLFVEASMRATAGWQSSCVGAVPRTVTRGI